jgi:hypothetical protein
MVYVALIHYRRGAGNDPSIGSGNERKCSPTLRDGAFTSQKRKLHLGDGGSEERPLVVHFVSEKAELSQFLFAAGHIDTHFEASSTIGEASDSSIICPSLEMESPHLDATKGSGRRVQASAAVESLWVLDQPGKPASEG